MWLVILGLFLVCSVVVNYAVISEKKRVRGSIDTITKLNKIKNKLVSDIEIDKANNRFIR